MSTEEPTNVQPSVQGGLKPFPTNLPPELLVEIFHFAISGDDAANPLTLGGVCKDWRTFAWSAPQLWSNVNLIFSTDKVEELASAQEGGAALPLFNEWLDRAGDLPLSISITDRKPSSTKRLSPEVKTKAADSLLDGIVSRSSRIRSLHLSELLMQFFDGLGAKLDNIAWPLLTQLYFHPPSCMLSSGSKPVDFSRCMALREATLAHVYLSEVRLPWSSLQHVTLRNFLILELEYVLREAVNLETLKTYMPIGGSDVVDLPPPASQDVSVPMHHRGLKEFSLSHTPDASGTEYLQELFLPLRLPALETLQLDMGNEFLVYGLQAYNFWAWLRQSGCRLQEMTIQKAGLHEANFIECLRHLPNLRTLHLSKIIWYQGDVFVNLWGTEAGKGARWDLGPEMFQLMAPNEVDKDCDTISRGSLLLPELESLTLHHIELAEETHSAIHKMLRSRAGGKLRLISLEDCFSRDRCH